MRIRASPRDRGVQRGGADACAHGGAKGARWGLVLCILVVALANARRSARQMHALQTTLICVSLSAEDASWMVGCGLTSCIQPCKGGTPWTDGATAKWFATRLGTNVRNSQIYATYVWTAPLSALPSASPVTEPICELCFKERSPRSTTKSGQNESIK